jgi:hypothetical protein
MGLGNSKDCLTDENLKKSEMAVLRMSGLPEN